MLACEPSLLAHAGLATTDIAITACLLALVYHFRTGREAGWGWRVAVPACWFGAALLAKASGLVFGPLCLCVVEGERLFSGSRPLGALASWKPFRRDLTQVLVGGILLAFLYCGSDWRAEPSFVDWAQQLPEGAGKQTTLWLAEHLRIFSNAGEGLVRQVKHNVRGHGTYLLGTVADRAIWYYFPAALTIKLSVPLLFLAACLLVFRRRALGNWACLCALALLAFSVTCRVQIGIRLVLPLVALAIVGLAAALARVVASMPSVSPLLRFAAVAFLLAGTTATSLRVWPHGLCYTNELWGGTARGYLVLSDSNYDWGQGLKDLAAWRRRHGEAPLAVWYFGTDPAIKRPPFREVMFQALPIHGPGDVAEHVRGHYLAVSTTLLHGSIRTTLRAGPPGVLESFGRALDYLQTCRPVDRTTTFLIYDFRETEAAVLGTAGSPTVTPATGVLRR
jgi:hypothetical protein